ncbi:MAG: nucleoid-associated protein [Brevinemataceae bacterium]
MIQYHNININSVSIHIVGNKNNDESITTSRSELCINENKKVVLINYLLKSFINCQEYYELYHESDIELNVVYAYASKIFGNSESLHEHSINLAKHLYEQSTHPKIKGGEFYVVYFKDCIIDGETVDAVGLFKSENKDTFLKVYPSGEGFEVESQQGVNINKLDKGCLIFNTEKENGYIVAVVDNTNKGAEAHYWIDDFLHIRQRKDEYYNTQNVMSLAKKFVAKELPKEFDVSKADQAELLNKTTKFFKEKDTFDMDEFTNEVMAQPEVIDSFNRYKDSYQQDREIEISDSFVISDTAVKKQARAFKSVIKLDKNFHIYIHGDRQLIEQGEDNKGKFYKVYYNEEH